MADPSVTFNRPWLLMRSKANRVRLYLRVNPRVCEGIRALALREGRTDGQQVTHLYLFYCAYERAMQRGVEMPVQELLTDYRALQDEINDA